MDQYFTELISFIKPNETIPNIDTILSFDDQEDMNYFLSRERNFDSSFPSEPQLITRIHHYLSILTNANEFRTWNTEIDNILKDPILKEILNDFTEVRRDIQDAFDKPQQWKVSLRRKITKDDRYSRLTVLPRFRSAERQVSPSHLRLSPEPNRAISASRDQNKSTISKQDIHNSLSRCSKSFGTLKDILPILDQLIFDTKFHYDMQSIIKQFNTNFEKNLIEWKNRILPQWIVASNNTSNVSSEKILANPISYLKSIDAYPTSAMMKQDKKILTGQWITSVILAHIDIHHIIHAHNQFQSGKINSSLSFDFHLETFHQLFHFIEQLLQKIEIDNNTNFNFLLNMCLRLFTTHLKYLSILSIDHHRKTTTNHTSSEEDIEWNDYPTDEQWQTWFDTLLALVTKESEYTICSRQAAKAIIIILEKQIVLFSDRLFYMLQHILENRHPILTEEFSIALTQNTTIMAWIDLLCNEHKGKNQTWSTVNSLIDLYPRTSKSLQRILERFQQLLFARLITGDQSVTSVFIQYLLTLFNQCTIDSKLFSSFLVNLSVLTIIEDRMRLTTIFMNILPILSDFIIKHMTQIEIADSSQFRYINWLFGKICHLLIIGRSTILFETEYSEMLKSPLFSCGSETMRIDETLFQSNMALYSQLKQTDYVVQTSFDDQELLLSVYNNTKSGAQLLSKMRTFTKDKHHSLQKSIEQQANNACDHLFAVYLKHYRRVNLVKEELSRPNTTQPHQKLLSLFEYAHRVRTTFATIRGQGGNCEEFYEQIRIRTLFLLSNVKESDWIPMIENLLSKNMIQIQQRSTISSSRLLQQTFNACLRFKTLMVNNKKRIGEKSSREETMHRTIVKYVYGDQSRWNLEKIQQCMSYQHERAIIRWITYRFIYTFLQKCMQIEENQRIMTFLTIFLPYVRGIDIEWSYLENISAVNSHWKEKIGQVYYSIIDYLLLNSLENNTKLVILIFHLLNLSYTIKDIQYLHEHELVQRLFSQFVTSNNQSNSCIEIRCLAYQWFRLYVLHLWKTTANEKNINKLSEEKWIFNELKYLFSIERNQIIPKLSFRHSALGSNDKNTTQETNQYLILLLRCVTIYEHVRNHCATLEYFNQLWQMYQCRTNLITSLLVLKIVRQLLFSLPKEQMKDLLEEILLTISNNIRSKEQSSEIVTELIYIYRIIMSTASSCQQIATEKIFEIIISNANSFVSNDTDRMNHLLACLSILGGYIHPFGLGSIVQIYTEDQFDQETQLGIILEINSTSAFPYLVQYCRTNQTRWVTVDQLRIELDVLPPYLLDLPISHTTVSQMFDALIYFIELDELLFDILLILSLKRRSISVIFRIMTTKNLLEIFMEKPYASIIAKLSTTALSTIHRLQPTDLHLLNKRHLEQYCLSLDRCEHLKQIVDNRAETQEDNSQFHLWHNIPFKEETLTMNIYDNVGDNNKWKSAGSKQFVDEFKQGRLGNENISIVPMMYEIVDQWMLEDCGIYHRFPGRMYLISETGNSSSITFTVDNLRLSHGKWYFCIRLLESRFLQIGWTTNGFNPSNTIGIGQDQYSWSYDGSQGMLYHQIESPFMTDNIHWNSNDVCGCGIEIDGMNTRINYWLNGHFLGTAFAHDFPVGITETICNMRPNGPETTYSPGVTLRVNDTSLLSTCEWIFSPEDMNECPLPNGHKPLLLPTILTVVRYPFNAYILSTDDGHNLYRSRSASTKIFLRDFVHQHHLETEFLVNDNRLILTEESNGFPFPIIDHSDSWTISFDFEFIGNDSKEDICLLTFGNTLTVRIPFEKVTKNTHIAIVFFANNEHIKTYINQEYKISKVFITSPFKLHLLPKAAVKIHNLAFWKDTLSEEQIRYLFNAGLTHIAADYNRLSKYRELANTWTFEAKQQTFLDESLVLLHEPFTVEKWYKAKCEAEVDEWKYFKPIDGTELSSIQFYGNRSYLILNKSIRPWSEYTIIIDIQIDHLPAEYEQLALITLNSNVSIYLTHEGQLCLTVHRMKSDLKLKLHQYVRLMITVRESSLKLYIDGILYLDVHINDHQLLISENHIDLFREYDKTKNTTKNNTIRIQCKSITFIAHCIVDINDHLKSTNHSLEHLVVPPYSIIAPSLILSGYDSSLIKSVLKQYPSIRNLYELDQILHQECETIIKIKQNNKLQRQNNLLTKMNPSIDRNKLQNLLPFSLCDTDEKVNILGTILFEHWNTLQISNSTFSSDKNWFDQTIQHLTLDKHFNEWIQDQSQSIVEGNDLTYQLFDFNRSLSSEQNQSQTSSIDYHWIRTQYSHENIPRNQLITLRIACEHGLISMYAHYTILTIQRIQYFFFHLFVQLPPDSTSMFNHTVKTFQIAILDFVYLLFKRNQNHLIDIHFTQSFYDLLMLIDILNILNIRPKRPIFPESFILQSITVPNIDLQLNQHELEQSDHYFDKIADLQLIDFMNQYLLINVSFRELILSLPTDSISHSTHYQNYPSLWHISAECIQIRVKFFCLFNIIIEKLVSMVDLSLPVGESFLTDKFRSSRSYILRTTKFQLLNRALLATALPSKDNIPSVNFDTVQASTTTMTTKTMFHQAYEQLHPTAHILFRRKDERLWRAQYLCMHSTDHGGPYRDSITCICADICSTRLPLFILCPNGRMNDGLNRDRWIPNVFPPNKSIPNLIKKQYRFVGQLIGMAIRKNFYLDFKFPTLLWKQLVYDEVTLEDIEAIDVQSLSLINEIEKMFHSSNQFIDTDNDVLNSILEDLRFEVMSANGQTFELIRGGHDIPITLENLKEYCSNYRRYRLEEFSRQIEYIRQGLYSVIPGYFLSLFTTRELEETVCGKGEIDIELLKRNTVYGSHFRSTSNCIQYFWTVLSKKFTEEQKKLFLKFVWGRSTLPSRDEDFTSKFVINPLTVDNNAINGALPRAHTCSFALDLPEYSSGSIMYDRLNYAITNCSSIDGDGNMNDMPVVSDYD
ncbi:hypothetical protein I4U23_027567 [Adineta vaga]|nr:hypothetical protein I4U23_027567 [Adineta vaga]